MSQHEYEASRRIAAEDYPFYALIMAAMRQADTANTKKLQAAWPAVWQELWERYHNTGGFTNAEFQQQREAAERVRRTSEASP